MLFATLVAGCGAAEDFETEPEFATGDSAAEADHPDATLFDNTERRLVHDSAIASELSLQSWGQDSDASGAVRVRMYQCSGSGQHVQVNCSVDPDEVLVGGGAYTVCNNREGALLTASYPQNNDLETWIAASKDHVKECSHTLHTIAIGMSLRGVDRSDLHARMRLVSLTSAGGQHPATSVGLPSGYTLIGGGARANWRTQGQLLVESYPTNSTTWRAASKDHVKAESGSVTAYAIGITTGTIPGFGTIQTQIRSASNYAAERVIGTVTRNPTTGWATTSTGGRSTSDNGQGRPLFRMSPVEDDDAVMAMSKDHVAPSAGTTYAYVIEARRAP